MRARHNMVRGLITASGFCAMMALAPLFALAQEATFHVDVKLVNIFVNVTDKNGAIVGGLNQDDFAVFEDDRPQQIALFERKTDVPLNLTLAIDTSGSVRKDLDEEAGAARHFAHDILQPKDRMSVLQFATDVTELTGFTNNLSQIDHAVGGLRSDFATALYDAIVLGSQSLGKREGRKVLVLVSDGDDTAKSSTYAQALEAALRNEVMIYSLIDVPIEASAGRDLGGEHALITLSEADRRKVLLCGRGRARQGLRQGERRPAHAVFDWLLSEEPGAWKKLPSRGDYGSARRGGRVQRAQQDRLLRRAPLARKLRSKCGNLTA